MAAAAAAAAAAVPSTYFSSLMMSFNLSLLRSLFFRALLMTFDGSCNSTRKGHSNKSRDVCLLWIHSE